MKRLVVALCLIAGTAFGQARQVGAVRLDQGLSVAFSNITGISSSKLLGRGSASSGAAQEITLGTGLSMSGTTLSASGGGLSGGTADRLMVWSAADAATSHPGLLADDTTGALTIGAQSDIVPVTLRAYSSGTSHIAQWQTSANGALGAITHDGWLRIGTPTTADADAESILGASATSKKALVIQAKATPTKPPFEVQGSDGTPWFSVQTDGNVVIDQRTGATFSAPLQIKYQGTQVFSVGYTGTASVTDLNVGGGYATISSAGDALFYADVQARHLLGYGTSPTVGGSCGTSPSIAGKDSFAKVTVGTGSPTSCTITFGTAYATAPVCVANAATTTAPLNISTLTTSVTISAAALTAGEVLHVMCGGF